jgi:hypothetical protein
MPVFVRTANDLAAAVDLFPLGFELARHPAKLDGSKLRRRRFSLLKNQDTNGGDSAAGIKASVGAAGH